MASPTEWHSLKTKKLTRRTVLKGTSKVGVGAAGLALVGCSDVSDEEFEVLQAQVAALTDALETEGVPVPEARPPRSCARVTHGANGRPTGEGRATRRVVWLSPPPRRWSL